MASSPKTLMATTDIPRFTQVWRSGWMFISTILTFATVLLLLWPPKATTGTLPKGEKLVITDVAATSSTGQILLDTDSVFYRDKLKTILITAQQVTYPTLQVTGSIVARLEPGKEKIEDSWQFSTSELTVTYTDWLKARAEVENSQKQFDKLQELVAANIERNEAVVARLQKLKGEGIPAKDLTNAEADLVQAKLQGQRDLFAAQSTLSLAARSRASLERQLQQAGLDPQVLLKPESNSSMVLVVANVPESRVSIVKQGQACQARLLGVPDKVFRGHVERISPTLSSERRSMRALFHLTDATTDLKPGMFAEIGLGTDPRPAVLVPAEALLHVGYSDYLLVEATPSEQPQEKPGSEKSLGKTLWNIVEVVVGEAHGKEIEITGGLKSGSRVIGTGAILLKPLVVQARVS